MTTIVIVLVPIRYKMRLIKSRNHKKKKRRTLTTGRSTLANIANSSAVSDGEVHYDDDEYYEYEEYDDDDGDDDDGSVEGRDAWIDEEICDECKYLNESDCSTVRKCHPALPTPVTVDTQIPYDISSYSSCFPLSTI